MKILEYLLIYSNGGHLEECSRFLGLQPLNLPILTTRYLEVHSRLVLWFYELQGFQPEKDALLEHVGGHLSGALVVADQSLVEQPDPALETINQLSIRLPEKPFLVGVRVAAEKYRELHPVVHRSGLFLSENGRLFFWTPQVPASIGRLWQALLLGNGNGQDVQGGGE